MFCNQQMHQDQGIQKLQQNLLNQFVQKYHSKKDESKNLMNSNNTTAIFLIGKSRVGKSSIFHILRGDELVENEEEQMNVEKGQSLIGIEGNSFTKIPNFHNYNITLDGDIKVSVDLIDTPGYLDNQDVMDEIISQMLLLQLFQMYQKIIFAVVTEHSKSNKSYFEKPLLFAENLIKKQINHDNFFDDVSICLIVNKFQSKNRDGPKNQIQKEIQKNNTQQRQYNIQQRYSVSNQFLRKIISSLFLLDNYPDYQKQQCFNKQFEEFVRKNQMINKKFEYKLSFEESSQAIIQNLLSDVRNIFQSEIQFQFNQFFDMLDKNQPQLSLEQKKDILLNLSQYSQDQTLLEDTEQYQFNILKNFFKNYDFEICISKKLDEYEFLFEKNIISNLIGYLRESYQEVDQNYIVETLNIQTKVWGKVVEVCEEILKKYGLNEEETQIFENICKQLVHFSNQKDWNNLYVFFGNPLSGKSTAINLLCKIPHRSKLFDKVLMKLHHGVLPKSTYNLIEYGMNAKNLFIEFQSFSKQYHVLLQYFYTYCQKNNKRFSISIVLNADMTLQNEIEIALGEFIELNQIKDYNCLNFIVNIKEGTNCPEKIEINFNKQRIESQNQYQKIYTIHSQFQEEFINIDRLNFFQQNKTQLDPQKLTNLSSLFQKNLDYLIQAFNLNCAKLKDNYKFINDQNYQQNVNLFVKLSRLNPKNENFEKELNEIQDMFGNSQFSNVNCGNHQKLKNLFEILFEKHQLFDKIKQLSKFIQQFLKRIEYQNIYYSSIKEMNQTDILNFLSDALTINPNFLVQKDKQNLECLKLFYNQFFDPSKCSKTQWAIKKWIQKIYQDFKSKRNPSKIHQTAVNQPLFHVNLFKEYNLFSKELLNQINQLQKLMELIKNTQKKGYISLDYWLFPLGIYYNRLDFIFGDKFENEQIKKQSDVEIQNIDNMNYIQAN